ncbi:Homeobox-leucine zipper protein HDG11 [Linum perenne]
MGNSPNHVVTVELDTMHSSEFQKSTTAVTTTEVLEPPTHRLLGLRAASESRSGFSTTMRQSGQLSSISRPCQQSTLDRVSSIAAKYIGRPISHLPPVQLIHVSMLDLSMASFGGHGMGGGQSSLDLDFDLLPQQQSS